MKPMMKGLVKPPQKAKAMQKKAMAPKAGKKAKKIEDTYGDVPIG